MLGFFDLFTLKEIASAHAPYALSPVSNPKAKSQSRSLLSKLIGLRTVPNLGILTTFIAADSDRAIVERTWGLFSQIPSKKEEFYGPNFSYSEYLKARNWFHGLLIHWGLGIASVLFATLPPLRKLVKMLVYEQGQGPGIEQAKKDEIEYRAVATPDGGNGGRNLAFCRAWFYGSMYACKCLFYFFVSSVGITPLLI